MASGRVIGAAILGGLGYRAYRRGRKCGPPAPSSDSTPQLSALDFEVDLASANGAFRARVLILMLSPASAVACLSLLAYVANSNRSLQEARHELAVLLGLSAKEVVSLNLAFAALAAALSIALVAGDAVRGDRASQAVWADRTVGAAYMIAALGCTLAFVVFIGAQRASTLVQAILALVIAFVTVLVVAAVSTWEGKSEVLRAERMRALARCQSVQRKYQPRASRSRMHGRRRFISSAGMCGVFAVLGATPFLTESGLDWDKVRGSILLLLLVTAAAAGHLAILKFPMRAEYDVDAFSRAFVQMSVAFAELVLAGSIWIAVVGGDWSAEHVAVSVIALAIGFLPPILIAVAWARGFRTLSFFADWQLRYGRRVEAELLALLSGARR